MATKNFKGFQLVALANFREAESDKNTLYFVRTSGGKGNGTDGFLYFNGKKYGTAKDVEAALTKKYGDLKIAAEGGQKDATIAEYVAAEIAKVNTAAGELGTRVTTLEGKVTTIEGEGEGSIKKAVADAKTALVGAEDTVDTIKHAEKLATDASKKVDTEIGKLDVTGNVSEAVKGVTVTVDETDGKVIKPVVSIADGTLTGAATDGNLVTGTVVKEYVDGKVSEINTAAGELGRRVTTLEGKHAEGKTVAQEVKEGIAGIAETSKSNTAGSDVVVTVTTKSGSVSSVAVDSSVLKKVVTDGDDKVKSDLLGNATTEYNTLGKLETKIKAAQSAADKVSGVKSGDKVISLGADGKLSSTISLSVDTDADREGKKYIRLTGIDGADLGKIDTANFVKDGMLDGSALYTATAATGTVTINNKKYNLSGLTANHAYIVLVWNTDAKKDAMAIDVTSLIDIYTAKADGGLVLDDHAFSVDTAKIATTKSVEDEVTRAKAAEEANKAGIVKLNATHAKVGEDFKTVATEVSEGIAGIAETSKANTAGSDVVVTVTTKSGSVTAVTVDSSVLAGKVSANDAAIKEEARIARAAEKANKDAIDILNGTSGVTGSVDKKIKDALEAGAVTLEVKDNDAYLGVTSATIEGKGTVYTLASKEAKIKDDIKNAADAVKVSVASAEDAYVTASVDEAGRVITLREKVQSVEGSSTSAKGLAEASDVKNYVDRKVSDKNVAAEGESGDTALVSASASGNKVTVATTQKLKDAVAKAESSVQSVNGKTGSTVTLTGADIATDQNVSGSANATVNAVLADIYSKIGAVKVSSQEKTITVDDTGRIIDVHRQTVTAAQKAGHVALECGNDGALYGVMYYSGDDVDA